MLGPILYYVVACFQFTVCSLEPVFYMEPDLLLQYNTMMKPTKK